MSKGAKILLVDDEADILEFISYNLEKEGFRVKKASNGEKAIELAKDFIPDLIILDIMMPGLNGIETCGLLRQEDKLQDAVILFLSARSESFTQISALDSGGDDIVVKPIKTNVLISRINALLRRHPRFRTKENAGKIIQIGDIEIDPDKYTVLIKGKEIALAKKEFDLLSFLATRPGKVFNRDEILHKVWGTDVIVGDRTIDVHIRKLREKLGKSYIKTLKGVGYKLKD